jgi:hypothetical protein
VEDLGPGLYETLITRRLKAQLDELAGRLPSRQRALRAAEAPDRIAWHLSRQIQKALDDVGDEDRVQVGLTVAEALLDRLGELVEVDPSAAPIDPATVLHAILRRRPDGTADLVAEPLIPLLDTTLLTNAPGEPGLWNQLLTMAKWVNRKFEHFPLVYPVDDDRSPPLASAIMSHRPSSKCRSTWWFVPG